MSSPRIWPEADHPIYRIPAQVAPWKDAMEDAILRYAEEYGLVTDPAIRRHLTDSHHGELAARAYVPAPPHRREVIARWFTWLFFIDDYYDGPIGRQEHGHHDIMAEMLAVMPLGPTRPPRAVRPLTMALQDTWTALAEETTLSWRIRFYQHIHQFVAMLHYESVSRARRRIPPFRYFEQIRPPASGTAPCLDLLEYAAGGEVPPLVYETAQFRTLHHAAVDVVAWINDAASLHREHSIGDVNNGVLVVQHDQGCTLQQAVDLVHARIAGSVEKFQRAEHDLTRLCDQWPGLADAARTATEECVRGMKRWMRGSLDWSRNTARYMPVRTVRS